MSSPPSPTGAIAFADGSFMLGTGFGHEGMTVGELCFNTAMTGYQEILTDPSYASQIVMFTAAHIGNTGINPTDNEGAGGARGAVQRCPPTPAANHRSEQEYPDWLNSRGLIGLAGVDTRALTCRIRRNGMFGAAIAHAPDGNPPLAEMTAAARSFAGLKGAELALAAGRRQNTAPDAKTASELTAVIVDFGVKHSIVARLEALGVSTHTVRPDSNAAAIMALQPDGVVLSNGPGDPAATARHVAQTVRDLVASGLPMLAICLGHQILALALGAKTKKMAQGHHGANHPVQDLSSGRIEIASMNHGFTVDAASLPTNMEQTHISLFDRSNCGLKVRGKPVLSVQHHPEAGPGPHDAAAIFGQFVQIMSGQKAAIP